MSISYVIYIIKLVHFKLNGVRLEFTLLSALSCVISKAG